MIVSNTNTEEYGDDDPLSSSFLEKNSTTFEERRRERRERRGEGKGEGKGRGRE